MATLNSADRASDEHESPAAEGDACRGAEKGREAAVAEKLRVAAETVEDFVREQPVKSLLIAAGVGLLAGLLILRRK